MFASAAMSFHQPGQWSDEFEGDADIMAQMSHVWHSNPYHDTAGHDAGLQVEALQGFALLSQHQIYPGRCKGKALVPHECDGSEPHLSRYSDTWTKLWQKEWYTSDPVPYFHGAGMQHYELGADDTVTRYHGTTLKALLSMMSTGGFIPGPNGHGHRGKYLQGLFCAASLGEAFLRVDPWREQTPGGHLDLMGCPVVVELEVASFRLRKYHNHRRDVRVVEAEPGVLMKGIKLLKVHVNSRYLWNFFLTQFQDVTMETACGQRSQVSLTFGCYISIDRQRSLCKRWTDPEIGYKANSGIVYCPQCAGMVCHHSRYIGRPPAHE